MPPQPSSPPGLGRALLPLLGAVAALWLTGWFGLRFDDPLSFNGDHMLWLGYARSFLEGNGFRWSDSLGFPGVRDHMYHPTFYLSQKVIMWTTARFVDSAAAVVSVFYGIGVVLTYGAAYWTLRRFAIDRGPAVLGAVAFLVTPFFALRAGGHDPFAVAYSVPAGAWLALDLGLTDTSWSRESLRRRWLDPLTWLVVVFVAASGVYYAFFTGIFVMVVGAAAAIGRRSVEPAARATLLSIGIVVALLVTGPGLGLIDVLNGSIQTPQRAPMEQAIYGLSLGDAVRSLAHLPFTPAWWSNGVIGVSQEGANGEWPGVLPTLVILASPIIAFGMALAGMGAGRDRRQTIVLLSAGCVTFGIVFATRAGLGLLFNEVVTASFRAHSRIMPFLTFFAIAMVLTWMQQARAARHRWIRVVVPLALVGGLFASVVESSPRFPLSTMQQDFLNHRGQQDNRQSILLMLERLRASSARTVLQLPIVAWPEVPSIRGYSPYFFELPHVLDTPGSGIRWSYGMSSEQAMFLQLSSEIDAHRDGGVASVAAAMGFQAIVLEKGALTPDETAHWQETIEAEVGPQCRLFNDARRTLYLIAATGPVGLCESSGPRPVLEAMRYVTAEGRFGRALLIGGGWSSAEGDHTWSLGTRALVKVPVPQAADDAAAFEVTFDFGIYRPDPAKPKRLVFQVAGRDVVRLDVGPDQPLPTEATVTVGVDDVRRDRTVEIVILTPDAESPSAYGGDDPRQLGIALHEFRVRPVTSSTSRR